eukprot:TRINITY_DN7667_c1_g1_i7.p1 TRINITY_DN7667_c1_g1~~TRINITY_DN7667_c1_g1_i7.p1  ORF type:complete len:619 (+),score=33.34 TRINITY_DN7667_c1_g1_i7:246-1859(+)
MHKEILIYRESVYVKIFHRLEIILAKIKKGLINAVENGWWTTITVRSHVVDVFVPTTQHPQQNNSNNNCRYLSWNNNLTQLLYRTIIFYLSRNKRFKIQITRFDNRNNKVMMLLVEWEGLGKRMKCLAIARMLRLLVLGSLHANNINNGHINSRNFQFSIIIKEESIIIILRLKKSIKLNELLKQTKFQSQNHKEVRVIMQAIYQTKYGGSSVLTYGTLPLPKILPKDILVENRWTGINPIDFKVREGLPGAAEIDENDPLIIGWDGAGVVKEVGPEATGFAIGDEVYYAGVISRKGSYAQYTAVDHRIVAKKPTSLDFAEAAAVPLVAITSWETMVEEYQVKPGTKVLIYNGAGGLGSFAIQLAKHLGGEVYASASRPETIEFCKQMGADHVINHREPLKPQIEALGISGFDLIFHCYDPTHILSDLTELLNPMGRIALTFGSSPEQLSKIDSLTMFQKRQTISFTFMYARPLYDLEPEKQGELLKEIANLIDKGVLKSTVTQKFDWKQMMEAHDVSASGKAVGKMVVSVPPVQSE